MKIYFLVVTQHDNLGDLLINKMLIDELTKYGSVYVDAIGLPAEFKNNLFNENQVFDFQEYYKGSIKRISGQRLLPKIAKDFDCFFKSPGPSGSGTYSLKSLTKRLVTIFQYKFFNEKGLEMNLIGNDVNVKLDDNFDVRVTKYSASLFDNYLVRSYENVKMLRALGINNASYIPDVAFLYKPNLLKEEKNVIGISLRDLSDKLNTNKIIKYLEIIIPFFLGKNYSINFFYQVNSDKEFNQFLHEKFKLDNVVFLEECLKYEEIENYNRFKFLITNRLHVMILGMIHNVVPLLILNNHTRTNKINRILKDFDLEGLMVDEQFRIEGIYNDYNLIKSKVSHNIISSKALCENKIKDVIINMKRQ